jgi:hypothetical protein
LKIRDPGLKVDSETFVGDPIKVGDRSIYPVLKSSIIKAGDGKVIAIWTYPEALAITEFEETYLASLTNEEISLDELLDQVPSLRDILKNRI